LADEAKSRSLGACLTACVDVELPQDRRDVMVNRPLGEEEALGDLRVVKAVCDEREHLKLAPCQAGWVLLRSGARPASNAAGAAFA
jgi:hypothetical protein